MRNIIDAIDTLIHQPILELKQFYQTSNRANAMGTALEEYIKDLFAGTLNVDESERDKQLTKVFSYLGNANNPPDMMLRAGDAIEVKKLESKNNTIALNSSYPKAKMFANSPLITKHCRDAEEWIEKDLLYTVGVVNKQNHLTHLGFIYGEDYAAEAAIYERIRLSIKQGINQIDNVEFTQTNELGKVKCVDPLGITDLRIRGMWSIQSPFKLFNSFLYSKEYKKFQFFALINEQKFSQFNNCNKLFDAVGKVKGFNMQSVDLKNPNNPAQLKSAQLITFEQ